MTNQRQEIVFDLSELPDVVEQVFLAARGRKKWTLTGEMGAGKTTFVQALCAFWRIDGRVSSPTYSLVNEYFFVEKTTQKQQLVRHIDLYRLLKAQEAIDFGIEDYLYDDAYCLIEWADLIADFLPENMFQLRIEALDDGRRKISFS